MWLNLMSFYIKWLKDRYKRKIRQTNPHTLIRLLAGYRYVIKIPRPQMSVSICFHDNTLFFVINL